MNDANLIDFNEGAGGGDASGAGGGANVQASHSNHSLSMTTQKFNSYAVSKVIIKEKYVSNKIGARFTRGEVSEEAQAQDDTSIDDTNVTREDDAVNLAKKMSW